jgi:mono/diheme cytochrome c family protein
VKARASRSRVAALALIGMASLATTWCTTVNRPTASYGIHATREPEDIERGRYLVYGPAHCASCHGDPARETELRHGHEVPLSGGRAFALGILGTLVAPNITSDSSAGIGSLSDDTVVSSLRYGISRHGRPLVPLMSFSGLADDDLRAVVSYLRSVPPVSQPALPHQLSVLGDFAVKVLLERRGPSEPPPPRVVPERTAEYGRYLAYTVAGCHGCHTQRNKLTGGFAGPAFAGGLVFDEPEGRFVTANLTPIAGGIVSGLSEQEFIERFRVRGRVIAGSPMPWEAYALMTENDLAAIYRYLRALQPACTEQRDDPKHGCRQRN